MSGSNCAKTGKAPALSAVNRIDCAFDDRAPRGWNQWGEVVSRTPRKPFFLGDLPHAWVASDFVRSALDMFAYHREADDRVVLAAGAVHSPAILLRSGVDTPGVGAGLQDHASAPMTLQLRDGAAGAPGELAIGTLLRREEGTL